MYLQYKSTKEPDLFSGVLCACFGCRTHSQQVGFLFRSGDLYRHMMHPVSWRKFAPTSLQARKSSQSAGLKKSAEVKAINWNSLFKSESFVFENPSSSSEYCVRVGSVALCRWHSQEVGLSGRLADGDCVQLEGQGCRPALKVRPPGYRAPSLARGFMF